MDWASDPDVYEPAEDSELLAREVGRHPRVGSACELGCGSGYVTASLSRVAGLVVAVDVEPRAVRLARENLCRAGCRNVQLLCGDLFAPIRGRFGLVCFNPPYLPGPPSAEPIDRAWAGGPTGRELVSRFVEALPLHLAEGGDALLVVSSLTGPRAVERLARRAGLAASVAARQRLAFEELLVLRLAAAGAPPSTTSEAGATARPQASWSAHPPVRASQAGAALKASLRSGGTRTSS